MSNNGKIEHIGTDGKTRGVEDEWWEQARSDYDIAGVPSELTDAARPLLEGNPQQQRLVHQFLMEHAGSWNADTDAHLRLYGLLKGEDMPVVTRDNTKEEEFNDAWDAFSGPASGPKPNRYTHNTSEEASRNRFGQGMPNKPQTGGGLHSGPGVED